MSATYRIGNKNKIDKDKFIEIINKVFNSPKLTIYSPKEGPNTSTKYNMFEFELEGEGIVSSLSCSKCNAYVEVYLGDDSIVSKTPEEAMRKFALKLKKENEKIKKEKNGTSK